MSTSVRGFATRTVEEAEQDLFQSLRKGPRGAAVAPGLSEPTPYPGRVGTAEPDESGSMVRRTPPAVAVLRARVASLELVEAELAELGQTTPTPCQAWRTREAAVEGSQVPEHPATVGRVS